MMDLFELQISIGAGWLFFGFVSDGNHGQNFMLGLEIEQLAQIFGRRNAVVGAAQMHLHPAGAQPLVFGFEHDERCGNRCVFNPNVGF